MRRSLLIFLLLVVACGRAGPVGNYTLIAHPDGRLYVGDRVSFELLAPAGRQTDGQRVQADFQGRQIGEADFQPYGVGQRKEAILWWAWDTRGLSPGSYTLTFTIQPDGPTFNESVSLQPAGQVPPPEPTAHWDSTTTACCLIHYITGTDAARDIAVLSRLADEQSVEVAAQFHSSPEASIDLTFLPRVLGHGGFTFEGVYVSYLDGNYINIDMGILLHHEFVHYYDATAGGSFRPSILQEGLAVYLSGGHFKPEPLEPRAAALLDLGWYIPLRTLADDFYHQQHEIGYLEAGALVEYLVDTYGWQAFNAFYREAPSPNGKGISDEMDASLRQHLGISFSDMEQGFQGYLKAQTVTGLVRTDLRLTVRFFDTVRRYQQAFDPSAYFLTAWLPDGNAMRQYGIVADLLRHPDRWRNRWLEGLLLQAQRQLFRGDYPAAERTLNWINAVLDVLSL